MAVSSFGRACTPAVISVIICVCAAQEFTVPDVKIEVFQSKGFRASIADVPGITFFAFQGNVNRNIDKAGVGRLKGEISQATNGRWVYENSDIKLKVGDVINYYIFVSVNRQGYVKDNLSYTVTGFTDNRSGDTSTTVPDCQPTKTRVRGGTACAGQTIFEDNFDSLRTDLWQIEQYLPIDHPEYPFVSYQRLSPNGPVLVSNGYLYIIPKLQQTLPGFNNDSIYLGTLDLTSGCTARAEACIKQASGAAILPPVASGRLTSSFAFTYGTVHVRAALPKGDWIYPEILLEPFLKKYGSYNYASGVIKIASARGNTNLRSGSDDYGNKVLYGGPMMDFNCRWTLTSNKILTDGTFWSDQFHVYSVTWTPDSISLSVDGEQWAHVDARRPLHERFTSECALPRTLLEKGSNIAPFDDFFYLTIGVAVGGISEFKDNVFSGDKPKPWRNSAWKAMFNFWEQMDSWRSSWSKPDLVVDYVRVVAL